MREFGGITGLSDDGWVAGWKMSFNCFTARDSGGGGAPLVDDVSVTAADHRRPAQNTRKNPTG